MSAGARPPRRRKHHEEHEEHENHERWLVSYADLVTVLMALFIVMFAISVVDKEKASVLAASIAASFGNPVTVLDGGRSPDPGTTTADAPVDMGAAIVPPMDPGVRAEIAEQVEAAQVRAAIQERDRARAAVEREIADLEETRRKLLAALEEHGLSGSARFRYDERGLVVSIVTDEVLFEADRAELSGVGRAVLDAVGPVLRDIPNDVAVEGHTNLVPVRPKYFPSEWELSSARAATVVRHLIEVDAVPAARMSAIGYADQKPLIAGTSPTANRLNRRVEVIVLSGLPADQRALLPALAPEGDALPPGETPAH